MRIEDFDYELPRERIAQRPIEHRSDSRLMLLDKSTGGVAHRRFRDLPSLLKPGDLLVLNDTKVFPARLLGHRPTGGHVELLLVERIGGRSGWHTWSALGRASKGFKPKDTVVLPRNVRAKVRSVRDNGRLEIEINLHGDDADLMAYINEFGLTPLPPYIRREPDELDRERYQTVYAERVGAVAAPTAGLHFTDGLLGEIRAKGIEVARVTLHVGPGTFQPVREEDPAKHVIEPEAYSIGPDAARLFEQTRASAGRVIAVGTTVVRALESAFRDGKLKPGNGRTGLFIFPGYEFKSIDLLITNFHLPRSSLLMLVCAFAGRERVLAAYAEALRAGYMFYSYGDAMLIGPGLAS